MANPGPKPQMQFRDVVHVQIHDSFTPLQMAPLMSLSMKGHNPMVSMTERPHGILVRTKGNEKYGEREFLVPYGNISHIEYKLEE